MLILKLQPLQLINNRAINRCIQINKTARTNIWKYVNVDKILLLYYCYYYYYYCTLYSLTGAGIKDRQRYSVLHLGAISLWQKVLLCYYSITTSAWEWVLIITDLRAFFSWPPAGLSQDQNRPPAFSISLSTLPLSQGKGVRTSRSQQKQSTGHPCMTLCPKEWADVAWP